MQFASSVGTIDSDAALVPVLQGVIKLFRLLLLLNYALEIWLGSRQRGGRVGVRGPGASKEDVLLYVGAVRPAFPDP